MRRRKMKLEIEISEKQERALREAAAVFRVAELVDAYVTDDHEVLHDTIVALLDEGAIAETVLSAYIAKAEKKAE